MLLRNGKKASLELRILKQLFHTCYYLGFEGHHNLSIASFWRTFDPYHLLINSPVTLPIPANFPYYVTTKTPLENLLASLMFQGQEFFAFTMFENDTKWEDFEWFFKSFHQCNSRNISSEVGQQLKKLQGASEVAEGNSNFAPWETERVKWPQGTVEFWSLSISVSQ